MRSSRPPAGLAPTLLGAVLLSAVVLAAWSGPAAAACELRSRGGAIKHVVHLQFDNVHLQRDNPNVPSDLEQMPHLLDFLVGDGTVGGNQRVAPAAQKASETLTVITGLHGDRTGVPIGDSYGTFRSDGGVGFTSAFGYWTATGGDGRPLMLSDTGRTVPAPWVPFTRAGCDVGAFAITGLTLQQLGSDVANVLDARATAGDPAQASADLLGIAIHCARNSPLCGNADARPDILPDEPGGYVGFDALFGNRHVQPVISPSAPVKDIDGDVIADVAGHPGFPGASAATAAAALGYAAAMLEAGVPVVYASIGDVRARDATGQRAAGPGERAIVARLADDDAAFKRFVDRLAANGISKRNTLFVVTSTGTDRFVGRAPRPPACDGVTVPCSYPQIGAFDALINRLLATERRNVTAFDIRPGSAPPFYIHGDPLAADPLTRTLQQDVGVLDVRNPVTGKTDRLAAMLADRAAMQILHMITASPARSPSFIMFGDPDYVQRTAPNGNDCALPPACVAIDPAVAWVSGNVQQAVGSSWFAIAGPGVAHLGQTTDMVSGPADLRPTMLALLGLADRYLHDGVVLADVLNAASLPTALAASRDAFTTLAQAYRDLNDPLGQFGRNSLALATRAIRGTDTTYARYLDAIGAVSAQRDALAGEIKARLAGAAFAHRPIAPIDAHTLAGRADALIRDVEDLAGSSIGPADRPWKAASDAH